MSDAAMRPVARVTPAEAAALLVAEDLLATFPVPADFDTGPSLGGRLRGALGAALAALPDRGNGVKRRDLFGLPTALDALFSEPPLTPPRQGGLPHAPARPYLLFVTAEPGRVTLCLRLFGGGRIWLPDLRRALRMSLCESGIAAWSMKSPRLRVPRDDLEIWSRVPAPAALPAETHALRIVTETPLRLASGRSWRLAADTVASSAVSRIVSVLAWSRISLDYPEAVFRADAARLELDDVSASLRTWQAHSSRQNRNTDYMAMTGAFTLRQSSPDLFSLLEMLPLAGLGLNTTRGLGQVAVLPVPGWT